MKKATRFVIMIAGITIMIGMFTLSAHATSCHTGDGDHEAHGESHATMDNIRMTEIKGHKLQYQLMDMRENLKKLKKEHAAHAMKASHHLMVMVDGVKATKDVKVGFLVIDPSGKKHKIMAMAMGNGFGADIPMMAKGDYTIKTKIAHGNMKLTDSFVHQIN